MTIAFIRVMAAISETGLPSLGGFVFTLRKVTSSFVMNTAHRVSAGTFCFTTVHPARTLEKRFCCRKRQLEERECGKERSWMMVGKTQNRFFYGYR